MHFRAQRKLQGEVSLSDTIETGPEGDALYLSDVVGEEDTMLEELQDKENRALLRRLIAEKLTKREADILRRRYGLDGRLPQTQRQVAAHYGISRSYVSRLEKKALGKLEEALRERNLGFDKPCILLRQQDWSSEVKMMEEAVRKTLAHFKSADLVERRPVPLSKLKLGVKCGGSDGFSGISANPAIGEVSDRVVTLGGGSALAEFPELCGVEANMISRCIRKEDKARFLELMRRYEAAANACGASISDNPSPGNIHDGLITDAIKSAGAAKKGGKAPISAVLDYAEPMPDAGLSLVCTPGNDVEAVTGLVAAGVNVVLFSTGLGTPTGNPIVPVIKVATNTAVAERLSDLIDFDCGPIIDGEPIAAAADRLLEKVLDTASGRYSTKADRLGQHDFLFWKREVSL